MARRKSTALLGLLLLDLALLLAFAGYAVFSAGAAQEGRTERRELVRRLGLTDLVLFTDARYTRHPSMADLCTPFQDAPFAMDHFPSGSLSGPPPHVRTYERHP